MEFEVLKRSHMKRNIIVGVAAVLIISAIIFNISSAKYRVTDSVPIINSKINYKTYDFKVMAMYQESDTGEYTEIEEMPNSGYFINEEISYCTLDNINKDNKAVLYTNEKGEHVFSGLRKNSKCYLYFNKKMTAGDQIIANKVIDNSRNNGITGTVTKDTTGTVYSIADDWGTSYVYAGAPTDNWVSFAGFYWRIIRINGDGSIRLIYNGFSTTATGTDLQIQTNAYNKLTNDNAYIGYVYGTTGANNYNETHKNTNNSSVKELLDNWYKINIEDKGYSDKISTEAGFCNDRKLNTTTENWWKNDSKRGYNSYLTAYAPLGRLILNNNYRSRQNPSLKCTQIDNDLFTVNGSSKGNNALVYPIGLVTIDEVILAGGFGGSVNNSYYLYSNQNYWTMSPAGFGLSIGADVFYVSSDGSINNNTVGSSYGIRPVINISANVVLSGNGTPSQPYNITV